MRAAESGLDLHPSSEGPTKPAEAAAPIPTLRPGTRFLHRLREGPQVITQIQGDPNNLSCWISYEPVGGAKERGDRIVVGSARVLINNVTEWLPESNQPTKGVQ